MRVFSRDSVRGLAAYFSSLFHGGDVLASARHQLFIASHLLGVLHGLCAAITMIGDRLPLSHAKDLGRGDQPQKQKTGISDSFSTRSNRNR
jgi:hypothetical protein